MDANYPFLAIDLGSYRSSNGGIFANSAFAKALNDGSLKVPPPAELPGAPELGKVNHVIVADEAFPMRSYFLQPYPGKRREEGKHILNLRLSRARRISEIAFGILTQGLRFVKGQWR